VQVYGSSVVAGDQYRVILETDRYAAIYEPGRHYHSGQGQQQKYGRRVISVVAKADAQAGYDHTRGRRVEIKISNGHRARRLAEQLLIDLECGVSIESLARQDYV
jgi:hypothetical protein